MTRLLLFLIAVYKRLLSPLLGSQCRFHPTCSSYAQVAIARFGPLRGSLLAVWRILRCHPLCTGGLDPVPARFVLRGCRTHDPKETPNERRVADQECGNDQRGPSSAR